TTAIGFGALVGVSNNIVIGNNSVTKIGGFTPWSNLSDGRFKFNIRENVSGLDFILKLRPVTYQLDGKKLDAFVHAGSAHLAAYHPGEEKQMQQQMTIRHTGFIAQEVEATAHETGFDFDGVYHP